jgi:hypothetical protein
MLLALAVRGCDANQLAMTRGPEVSEATGQNTLTFRLRNVGTRPCALHGYPAVALVDRTGALPFAISHRGDQMITARRPARFTVAPRGTAFFALNKYRCDLGDRRRARAVRLELGAGHVTATVPRFPDISFCGRGDPGSTVAVSPFEPTLRLTLRSHSP